MKTSQEFKSNFKDMFTLYIKFKQSQGYDYESMIKWIRILDKYLYKNKIEELNEKNINKLCEKRESEKPISTFRRQNFLKNFALFMISQGYENVYVFNQEYIKYEPANMQYIYTKNDIDKLFHYLNNFKYNRSNDFFFEDNLRVLITLFYCTGLRASEGFNLKYEDVNLNEKTITIKHSKNNITRTLPLSDSVFISLKDHIEKYECVNNDYVFKTSNGTLYNRWFVQIYKRILDELQIYVKDKQTPRLHDLRFTFAVNSLNQMEENNMDIYVALPLLQQYMGHESIKSTEYYLKYTNIERNHINQAMESFNKEIYGDDNA